MNTKRNQIVLAVAVGLAYTTSGVVADESSRGDWLWSTAHVIPKHTTNEGSGYFSIVEGRNGRIYIGTAKYGENAYLVEFDPATGGMNVVVDAHKEIGTDATGFAAQAKFHTRNNVGESGRVYIGTKQGYPKRGEPRLAYPGGYPMVYDPATGKTRVYRIPIPHHGISSVTPDESRNVAYVSTCSDERHPTESSYFLQLNLTTGKYRTFLDCEHMYPFIVVDWLGRAYHPILGGDIARFDPSTNRLERLAQTIDGKPPTAKSLLADPLSHPISWELSPDRKTLYAVAMNSNALYAYNLTESTDEVVGRTVCKLISNAQKVDCRAMCVAPDGTVWAGIAATFEDRGLLLTVASYEPKSGESRYHGPIAVRNRDFTKFQAADGSALPFHRGFHEVNGHLVPHGVILGICAAKDGTVYVTTLAPLTVHAFSAEELRKSTTVQSKDG